MKTTQLDFNTDDMYAKFSAYCNRTGLSPNEVINILLGRLSADDQKTVRAICEALTTIPTVAKAARVKKGNSPLSKFQAEIIRLTEEGKSALTIAKTLKTTICSVHNTRARARRKLGIVAYDKNSPFGKGFKVNTKYQPKTKQ